MPGLSLLDDILFKIIFGTEKNSALLEALLNALLALEGKNRILELEILNPYQDKEHLGDKGTILDVKARDGAGRLYNVEVQVSQQPAYVERALYYLARLFSSQLEQGDPYRQIARTIGISLLDFPLFEEQDDLHSQYRFYDVAHGRELTNVLELHFVELSKFGRDRPQELRTPFEKWLHLLKFGQLYEDSRTPLPRELTQEPGIEKVVEEMRRVSASEQVRWMIEDRRKAQHDAATQLWYAEKTGLERGLQQGLQQARDEAHKQLLETARRMRQEGLTTEAIVRVTGLSPDEIDK